MNKAAAACSASCDVALLGRELARVLECVDGVYCFIASNGFDARKTQGETAGVSCAWLNGIEGDLEHDVSAVQLGAIGRAAGGQPDDDHPVVDHGDVKTEPRPRRAIGPSQRQQVIENRFEEVDRHDHVEMIGLSFPERLLQLERTDADPE